MALSDPQSAPDIVPELLTPEEAAAIARCSIKTVRRAYTSGALIAYRRRGSRAVLLDPDDVGAWVRGQLVRPSAPSTESSRPRRRSTENSTHETSRRRASSSQLRLDLSAHALRAHRNSKTDCDR